MMEAGENSESGISVRDPSGGGCHDRQDAVRSAKEFHDRLGLTGIILTKMDGDARGGAALSIKR